MNARKLMSWSICLLVLFIVPLNVSAGIIGKGSASIIGGNSEAAKKQALRNAMRNAVEQGAGLFLDSESQTKDFMLIKDEVFSTSRGFIKQFKVLKEERKGDTWFVEIDAQVAAGAIQDKLKELRILHQKMGNKRLMVIYNPLNKNALPLKHGAVTAAVSAIESDMLEKDFRIFDSRSLGHIYDRLSQQNPSAKREQWVKIASQNQVDILIEFELVTEKKRTYSKYAIRAARLTLNARAFEVSTGLRIASRNSQKKQMTKARMGSYDWNNALSSASTLAGQAIALEIEGDIVRHYEKIGDIGNAYMMIFKGFSKDEEFEIIDILKEMEGDQRTDKHTLTARNKSIEYFELDYFSSLDKSDVERKLYLACKAKGIRIVTKEMTGNRFTFVKP